MEFDLLNLLLVLAAAWGGGLLATRLGYPSVLGELLAGIVLGPPLLGLLEGSQALAVLAEVGILLMMLYIGMEIDPKELGKASKAGLLAALGGFITPFLLCYAVVVWTGGTTIAAVFVGTAAGVTALAAKSRILADLGLLSTRISHVMMTGSLLTDTFSLLIFAALVGVAQAGEVALGAVVATALKAVAFFGMTLWVGLRVFPWLGRWLRRLSALSRPAGFALILLIALGFAELAELAGLHGILGTFMAGLFLRENALGHALSRATLDLVRDASLGLLAPIFFVTAGFAVTLDVFTQDLGLLVVLVGLAMVGKIVGTALFYLPTGYGWREGLVVGVGMNGRGVVEIIIAQIALSLGLISQEIFSILVFMAIFTTAVTPMTLKWGVAWLRRRGELVQAGERAGTLIVGAGPTARALASVLARSGQVRLIDRNAELCALAQAEGLAARAGNALDDEALAQSGAAHVQTFLAVTPNAEVNALAAQRARATFGIPEVGVVGSSDAAGHAALVEHLGAATLFGGPVSLAEWDYRLDQGRAEHGGLPVERALDGGALFAEVQAAGGVLPLALRRGERYLPLLATTRVAPGDRLIVLRATDVPVPVYDRFDRLAARCPVLDLARGLHLEEAMALVAAALAPTLGLSPDALIRSLLAREALATTVLIPGLAVPHVLLDGQGRFEMAIVRCREGIVFPGQPERVHALFVLAGTEDERTFHLRALSAIAQLAQWPSFDRDWLVAPDAEALRELVLRSSRRRMPEAAPAS